MINVRLGLTGLCFWVLSRGLGWPTWPSLDVEGFNKATSNLEVQKVCGFSASKLT